MAHNLDQSLALLSRTPAALNALLRDLPDGWTRLNEGGESWSVYDVIGHLIHAERTDWLVRIRIILTEGEGRPFPRFDRTAQLREREGRSLAVRLDEFAAVRTDNLHEVRALHLGPAELAKTGTHPVFGTVTLSQLLATWAAHDLTHLHQISRVMAHQYREAVGPWTAFLGVLQCGGHSV